LPFTAYGGNSGSKRKCYSTVALAVATFRAKKQPQGKQKPYNTGAGGIVIAKQFAQLLCLSSK
jgi:hypothetical protein